MLMVMDRLFFVIEINLILGYIKRMDKRNKTSAKNGKLGGRPNVSDMGQVVRVLLRGLKKLAEVETPIYESVISLAQRKLIQDARKLVSGFDEVISESRSVYLANLQKMHEPNEVIAQQELQKKLMESSREVRQYLRIIAVKAEVLLQDIVEQNIKTDSDLIVRLEKISKIRAQGLDDVVKLILGVIGESLDQFGMPI